MPEARPVVILTAMPIEAAPFVELLEGASPVDAPAARLAAVRGLLRVPGSDARPAVVVTTGVGLVAASVAASWAAQALRPSAIVSAGTAGGLPRDISVGDVAVSDGATYGTADATEFGYDRGQVPGQPVRFDASGQLLEAARAAAEPHWRFGRVLSGDTFVTARNVADTREAFPDAVATDMETCAIAQTASAFGLPWLSVRGISDLCGPEAGQDFRLDAADAAARSRDAVVAVLGQLP